jgi:RNA polymerase sigma-70 factor (ECF subfamily)
MADAQTTAHEPEPRESDPELLRLLANAAPVLRRVAPSLMGAVLRQRCRTSDLVQSALADAVASLPSYRGQGEAEFIGWTLRILEHNALDRRRRCLADRRHVDREQSNAEGRLLEQQADHGRSPSQVAVDREELTRMAKALRKLPAEQRRILQVVALRGCSHAEAARLLDRSEGACRVLLARAKANLLVIMARLAGDATR